jgi:hypothetical protein
MGALKMDGEREKYSNERNRIIKRRWRKKFGLYINRREIFSG